MDKAIEKEFTKLISKEVWKTLPSDYIERFKTYKCRFINNSGKNTGISYWKKVEMLQVAGRLEIKIVK